MDNSVTPRTSEGSVKKNQSARFCTCLSTGSCKSAERTPSVVESNHRGGSRTERNATPIGGFNNCQTDNEPLPVVEKNYREAQARLQHRLLELNWERASLLWCGGGGARRRGRIHLFILLFPVWKQAVSFRGLESETLLHTDTCIFFFI